MAPKGGNSKKETGRAKKAENEAKKQVAAEQEKDRKEAARWDQGAKGKNAKEEKEAKRKEAAAAKVERDRLLAEEEASMPNKPKVAPKAIAKKKATAATPAVPGSIAAGGNIPSLDEDTSTQHLAESFAATGIDNAIDLLDVVNAKTDKASKGSQAAGIEKHPERRFKAVFEAYKERELPNVRADQPGLRLNQYQELLFKQFQKSPENPFNQAIVAYDATKEERLDALDKKNREIQDRLRERSD